MINQNKLAKIVAKHEGKKEEISIAQIKEVMAIILRELAWYKPSEILRLFERIEK